MRNRAALLFLYAIATSALVLAVGLPPILLVAIVVTPLSALAIRPPVHRFIAEVVILGLVALMTHNVAGVAVVALVALASLTITRAAHPSPDRAIIVSLMITVVAAFIQGWTAWSFLPLSLVGIFALVNSGDVNPLLNRERSSLALLMAGAAIVISVIVGLFLHVMPWQTVLAAVFTALAYPFIALLSRITFPHHHARQTPKVGVPLHGHGHTVASVTHLPQSVTTVLILIVILIVGLILYVGWRYWSRPDEELSLEAEDGILRERLTEGETERPWRFTRSHLSPVREWVWRQLRRAKRQKNGRQPHETLREWLTRVHPSPSASQASDLYDAIRYGDHHDTEKKKQKMETLWPKT